MGLQRDESGKLIAYAFPGGYPVYYLDREDSVLCPDCANALVPAEQKGLVAALHEEGEPLSCDECGKTIESAYGAPEA